MAKKENLVSEKNKPDQKPADIYFEKYAGNYTGQAQKLIYWFCVPLFLLGLLGIFWAIPFPYLKFLGQYNGFFNWASFLIAFSVYYYYKLSPKLSYGILLALFVLSYGVMELDSWHKAGGLPLWLISLIILILSLGVLFSTLKISGRKASLTEALRFLSLSPIWLLHFLFKK